MANYNLSKIENVEAKPLYENIDLTIADKAKIKNIAYTVRETDTMYNILKYDKEFMTPDSVETIGKFRSVVYKNGKLLCFSPPKSESPTTFGEKYKNYKGCIGEEFIEGTMINIFFDKEKDDWEICTKSTVGGRNSFFRDGAITYDKTFRYMFLAAAGEGNLDFDDLCKEYCYSFVLQHPDNRIVTLFNQMSVYLIACYKINNEDYTIQTIEREEVKKYFSNSNVKYPKEFDRDIIDSLSCEMLTGVIDYNTMGIVVKHKESGDRMTIRNPNYEYVRKLKGNQPKLQYQYIVLRKEGNVSEYLKYFPEVGERFAEFRQQLHIYTQQLFNNYRLCYIKKTKPLIQYPQHFRTHMFTMHQEYLTELRQKNQFINKQYVINYINCLHPSQLMFSINFPMRQRQVETRAISEK